MTLSNLSLFNSEVTLKNRTNPLGPHTTTIKIAQQSYTHSLLNKLYSGYNMNSLTGNSQWMIHIFHLSMLPLFSITLSPPAQASPQTRFPVMKSGLNDQDIAGWWALTSDTAGYDYIPVLARSQSAYGMPLVLCIWFKYCCGLWW